MPVDTPAASPQINPWIVAISVMLATFMEVLDTTVVNVSLPHIAGSLSASVNEATWVLTSYLVANAIVLPITGWLANYYGRKRLLMGAVVGFTAASFLCAVAPNLSILIIFRVIQGATGGALAPLSQALLLEAFPLKDRGKAMAFWAFGIMAAPMLGPVLGGWLTDSYSWRWVFYINIPFGMASIIMTKMFIFDPSYIRRSSAKIDYWGIGLLVVGVGALQIVLDKGQELDWFASRWITVLSFVSFVTMGIFIVYELRTKFPVVNLRILKITTFSMGAFLTTVIGFVLYSSMVILPIMLQTLMGYPAVEAGIAMFPRGLGAFIAMPIVGAITFRFDPRKLLVLGLVGTAYTLFQFSWLNLDAGYWDIFWPQFVQGFSMAFMFVPLTTVTMNPITNEEMGNATSIVNFMRNIGGSLGIASTATILARGTQRNMNILGAHVSVHNPLSQMMIDTLRNGLQAHGGDMYTATKRAHYVLFEIMQRQASILSFVHTFAMLGIVFLLAIPLVFLLKKPDHRGDSLHSNGASH